MAWKRSRFDSRPVPQGGIMSEMIAVHSYRNRFEAEAAQADLAAAGIDALVSADDASGWQPGQPFVRGVRVMVSSEDLAAARRIIATTAE